MEGLNFSEGSEQIKFCEFCKEGKQIRSPFPSSGNRVSNILDHIHSDLCGPMKIASIGGAKYFPTFTDDFPRKLFVYFLKSKSDAISTFKDFKQFVETQGER